MEADTSPLITRERRKRRNISKIIIAVAVTVVAAGVVAGIFVFTTTNSEKSDRGAAVSEFMVTNNYLALAKKILKEVPLIDGHNDLPFEIQLRADGQLSKIDLNGNLSAQLHERVQTDIPLMKAGGVGGQFWSVFTMCNTQYKDAVEKALQLIDLIKRFTKRYGDFLEIATTSDDIIETHKKGKVASLIGVEGGHMISNSMSVLRMFYEAGVRYLTLTWNCNTPWADSNRPDQDNRTLMHGGLTDWGRLVVKEMNRLGMLVDLAHVSADTMRDAIKVSRAPVIFSHSSAYGLCPHPRNVPDDVLELMKNNNGIVMVNFYTKFINCTLSNRFDTDPRTASISQVAEHLEYLKNRIGPDRIGLGSDFNGVSSYPTGLEDSSKYPNLIAELLRRGWSTDDVKKVVGLNLIRVLRAVEKVRDDSVDMLPIEVPLDISKIPVRTCKVYPWSAPTSGG